MLPRTKKVLLVEDDIDCRNILAVIINQLGYQVAQASLGRSSLEKAQHENPDLILVSLDYPYLKAIKAFARFQSDRVTRGLPIIVYPPWESESIARLALTAGATEVLTEPFSVDGLSEVLRRHAPLDGESGWINAITTEMPEATHENLAFETER